MCVAKFMAINAIVFKVLSNLGRGWEGGMEKKKARNRVTSPAADDCELPDELRGRLSLKDRI